MLSKCLPSRMTKSECGEERKIKRAKLLENKQLYCKELVFIWLTGILSCFARSKNRKVYSLNNFANKCFLYMMKDEIDNIMSICCAQAQSYCSFYYE